MHEAFARPEFVDFFTHSRNLPGDLYPSEWHFLPELARSAESILDVGCAAGGFAEIWRTFHPGLRYTGVDISEPLVEAARELHPHDEFILADAATCVPLPDRAADLVAALGWLHWEPRWQDALHELWRLTGRALFFDVRLHEGAEDLIGTQSLLGGGETSYLCIGWRDFRDVLDSLAPGAVRGYGYLCPPAATVRGMPPQVCPATFVLDREPGATILELPFKEPA